MIDPAWVGMMARYNSELNRRLYAAAGRLPDAALRAERGAFFGSIHGTLAHLVWADRMWMSRFDGWEKPAVSIVESARFPGAFEQMAAARVDLDTRLEEWAGRVSPEWLAGDLTWFSMAEGRELTRPIGLLVTHVFNHQTHHRGQVHAMLTAAGERTGDTDLMLVV